MSYKRGYLKSYSVPTIKFDNIPKLTDSSNYQIWAETVEHLLSIYNCWDIITKDEGLPTAPEEPSTSLTGDALVAAKAAYDEAKEKYDEKRESYVGRSHWAQQLIASTVDPKWITLLTRKSASAQWAALRDKFARENTVSFYHQFSDLLNTKLDDKAEMASHLPTFDQKWTRLQRYCAGAKETDSFKLPLAFKPLFESLEAKAAFLLLSLPPSLENVVDNLQTKQDLTYDQAYQRLLDLPSTQGTDSPSGDKAYTAKGKGRAIESSEGCTWCRKHHPTTNWKDHRYTDCRKLAARNKKKADEKEKKKTDSAKTAVAEVHGSPDTETVRTSSSRTPWVFDTGATSHMACDLDLFVSMEDCSGTIRVADGRESVITARGSVSLAARLPNGSV